MDDAELTLRVCRLLARIPGWRFREDGGPLDSSVVEIVYGTIPPAPDRAVGVRIYGGADDRGDVVSRRAQLILRGEKERVDGADRLAGQALTTLHAIDRTDGISSIRRSSFGPLGADANGREERSENYQIILDNPEA